MNLTQIKQFIIKYESVPLLADRPNKSFSPIGRTVKAEWAGTEMPL